MLNKNLKKEIFINQKLLCMDNIEKPTVLHK